jgi:hypothetical protein
VIAVAVGLLGAGSGQAFADPPQYEFHQHLPGSHANVHSHPDWSTVAPPRPFDRQHAPATGGRTVTVGTPSGNSSFDAWPAVVIVTLAALLGAVTITRRHRLPTAT